MAKTPNSCHLSAGFTLLELSIVLVIIGLIIGGVTVGGELIKQAELRAAYNQTTTFQTAYHAFKLKYGAKPGDLKNAFSYWPSAGCTNADVNTTAAGCNGNGDGSLGTSNTSWDKEPLRAWQFMSLARMIPGSYDGVRDGAFPGQCPLGKVVPQSKLSNGGFEIADSRAHSFAGITLTGDVIVLAANDPDCLGYSVISPQEAHGLDQKFDEGRGQSGKIQATLGGANIGNCVFSGAYDLGNGNLACYLFFGI